MHSSMMWNKAAAKLGAVLKGTLLLPPDSRYEDARQIYNRRIDRRPAMIACCADEDDVAWCVRLAREFGIPLSVRAGGHGPAGHAVADGGLVIDLSPMNGVQIDAQSRVAVVQGGARWYDLDRATARHGLVAVGGHQLQVGVSGLVLVGGWGVLSRLRGLAADNLIRARVVCADGQVRTVSETEYPELFWALRGAGAGHFGVVTSLELRLYEAPPLLKCGNAIFPIEAAARVVPAMLTYMDEGAPRELGLFGSLRHHHGRMVFMVLHLYCGPEHEADRAIAPILKQARPIARESCLESYLDFKERFSATVPHRQKALWKSGMADRPFDSAAVEMLAGFCREAPTELGRINFEITNGAIHDPAPDATAFAHRSQLFCLNIVSLWDCDLGKEADRLNESWARNAHAAISPLLSGRVYPGYTDPDLTDFGRAYWGENYPRLCEIKRRWDPDCLFGVDQVIGKAE